MYISRIFRGLVIFGEKTFAYVDNVILMNVLLARLRIIVRYMIILKY